MPPPSVPLDAITLPAFLYDASGRVTAATRMAEMLAGRPLAGLSALAMVRLFHPRRPDGTPLAVAELPASRALGGVDVESPLTVTLADGRAWDIVATGSPLQEGAAIAGALVIWQDRTERKQTESALWTRGQQLEMALEAAGAGMWIREGDGDWIATPRLNALFGLPADAPPLGEGDFLTFIHPEDLPALREAWLAARAGRADYQHEYRVVWPDGTVHWLASRGRMVTDDAGTPRFMGVTYDITEKRRVIESLCAGQQYLADVIDATGAAYFHVASDLSAGTISRRFAEFLGLSHGEMPPFPAFVQWVLERLHPEDPPAIRAGIAAFIEGKTRQLDVEFRVRARDGADRWMRCVSASVERDPDGRVRALAGLVFDVTDQKHAEEALRRHAEELETLMETVPVGIFVSHDPECHDIRGNRMANMLHESEEGGNISATPAPARRFFIDGREVGADDLPLQVAARRNLAVRNAEIGVLFPSGRTRFVLGSAAPLRAPDGTVRGSLGGFVEITKRKEMERALQESDHRLHLALEVASVGAFDWDLVTGEEIWDDRIRAQWGLRPGAPVTHEAWEAAIHPEDREAVAAANERALDPAGDGRYVAEYRVIGRGDGVERWITVRGQVFFENGRPVRMIGTTIDLSERRRAEAALAEYAARLEHSNQELQRFAYVASHDLQEPLRSIVSFAQLLDRRYRGRLDADADEFLDFIIEGGCRMQALIQDLLQLSRIETMGKPFCPTDAGEVVAEVLRSLESPLREAGATVTVGEMPRVMADAAQLAQVLTNLVGNAIKYRRPEVPLTIRNTADRVGRAWQFAVIDNGIGIEAEYFDRIFVIFQRLHTKEKYDGTGIGLAVVEKIVERHGGRVWVESMPGEGSTFFFTLPAA